MGFFGSRQVKPEFVLKQQDGEGTNGTYPNGFTNMPLDVDGDGRPRFVSTDNKLIVKSGGDDASSSTSANVTDKAFTGYQREPDTRCATVCSIALLVLWLSWLAWLVYVIYSDGFPFPQVSITGEDIHFRYFALEAVISVFIGVASFGLLYFIGRAIYRRTKSFKTTRGRLAAYAVIVTLIALAAFVSVAPPIWLWRRCLAHSIHVHCDAMPVSITLTGSPYGLPSNWNDTEFGDSVNAMLVHSDDAAPLATWVLARPSNSTLEFTRLPLPVDPADSSYKLLADASAASGGLTSDGVSLMQIKYDLASGAVAAPDGYTATFSIDNGEGTVKFLDLVTLQGPNGFNSQVAPDTHGVELKPPRFTLHAPNADGPAVLQSLSPNNRVCRRIKVCATAWDVDRDTEKALETLVPLGLALYYQANYAFTC